MPNCGENYPGNVEFTSRPTPTPEEVIIARKDIGNTLGYILDACVRNYCFKNAELDEFMEKLKKGKFGSD